MSVESAVATIASMAEKMSETRRDSLHNIPCHY